MKKVEEELRRLFGNDVYMTPLDTNERMGRRIHGVDLTGLLSTEQAEFMVNLLDLYKVVSFPDQDQARFRLRHLERLANHFGAPIPHPKNYANYIEFKKKKAPLKLLPTDQQTCSQCDQAWSH